MLKRAHAHEEANDGYCEPTAQSIFMQYTSIG